MKALPLLPLMAILAYSLVPTVRAENFPEVKLPTSEQEAVIADTSRILAKANLDPQAISLGKVEILPPGSPSSALIACDGTNPNGALQTRIDVRATAEEWSSAYYLAIRKLGFLFPHPRMQISPKDSASWSPLCGKEVRWQPRMRYRGFHLHTQHPNEWIEGFLIGGSESGYDFVRWLARNQQNLLQVVLLKTVKIDQLASSLNGPYLLAHKLGILTGLHFSFASAQQKSLKLITNPFPWMANSSLKSSLKELQDNLTFDFATIELGSSEFTSTSYTKTLEWLEIARTELEARGRRVFVKVHSSSNQTDPVYGNFNYLPQFANPSVGILPHTVMFYDLEDAKAPVYGRENFHDLAQFTIEQNPKRPTWYFPETSYWVAMDMDVPLLLTDYLVGRSRDTDWAEKNGITGQIDFSSGQELGYWLFDWTFALQNDRENAGDPLIGLKLLGEDPAAWQPILDFQTRQFKENGLLAMLSSSTLLDELPWPAKHKTHERFTLGELKHDPNELLKEIDLLHTAISLMPSADGIKNEELRNLIEITHLRIKHAYAVRRALAWRRIDARKAEWIAFAAEARSEALGLVQSTADKNTRYPELKLFEMNDVNPTSYGYGYLMPARTLHFWEREERMVDEDNFNPFFMNIYDPIRTIF